MHMVCTHHSITDGELRLDVAADCSSSRSLKRACPTLLLPRSQALHQLYQRPICYTLCPARIHIAHWLSSKPDACLPACHGLHLTFSWPYSFASSKLHPAESPIAHWLKPGGMMEDADSEVVVVVSGFHKLQLLAQLLPVFRMMMDGGVPTRRLWWW